MRNPIGPEVWGDTHLIVPDAAPGTRYRDVFTGVKVGALEADGSAFLPLAEMFANFPFALLERTA